MKLYELTEEMNLAAESLEAALAWQPDTDADGKPVDDDGNVIENVEAYRADMLAAWRGTLEGISGEFDEKAGNIAAYIKNLKSDCEQLKKEETALKSRRRVKENALELMLSYLLDEMNAAEKKKIESPQAVISVRNNPESVNIPDEQKFIAWAEEHNDSLLKYAQPEIRRTEVKALLKSGQELPGAALTGTQSVIIK